MTLTQNIKDKITEEFNNFINECNSKYSNSQYGNMTDEKRKDLGAFYTPPELTILMLEKFDCTLDEFANKTILDPTCGSGNLILGALIVGSSINKNYPEKVFGNELDAESLKLCRNRFIEYCKNNEMIQYGEDFWNWHIHQGNALEKSCIEYESFTPKYRFDEKTGKRAIGLTKGFNLNKRR